MYGVAYIPSLIDARATPTTIGIKERYTSTDSVTRSINSESRAVNIGSADLTTWVKLTDPALSEYIVATFPSVCENATSDIAWTLIALLFIKNAGGCNIQIGMKSGRPRKSCTTHRERGRGSGK